MLKKYFRANPPNGGRCISRILLVGVLLIGLDSQKTLGQPAVESASPAQEFTHEPEIHTQCRVAGLEPCTLMLHGDDAPAASPQCRNDAWRPHLSFQQPESFSDSDGDGWWETVLELDLDPGKGCNCAVLHIYFSGTPAGIMVNIGDSASNNGQGGDAGTHPLHSAELQVTTFNDRPQIAVFTTKRPDLILRLNLPDLDGDFLEVEVCDQFLRFAPSGKRDGPGAVRINTLKGQNLFALGPADGQEGTGRAADPWIYAAFNRVIHHRRGLPTKPSGRGVSRVEIVLTP